MSELMILRLKKALYALSHPSCWGALGLGVAPSIEHRRVLRTVAPDCLIDVGANCGQFTLMARAIHQNLRVEAFEPLPGSQDVYRRIFAGQPNVALHGCALGRESGRAILHVSGRADSSSLLPIGSKQTEIFPNTKEVGTIEVAISTLDSLDGLWNGVQNALLKLDVQGFELSVLQGGRRTLRHCAYVYAECSHVSLYTGQALYHEVESFLSSEGFRVTARANEQYDRGELIQADYLFSRVESYVGQEGGRPANLRLDQRES